MVIIVYLLCMYDLYVQGLWYYRKVLLTAQLQLQIQFSLDAQKYSLNTHDRSTFARLTYNAKYTIQSKCMNLVSVLNGFYAY